MASKKYDLAVAVGSYTDSTGQQKKRYQNVGIVMQGDNGMFILLERWFNPAGIPHDVTKGNSIMISMFEPRPKTGSQSSQQSDVDTSDIPF